MCKIPRCIVYTQSKNKHDSVMSDIARVIVNYYLCKFADKNSNFNLLQNTTKAITCKKFSDFIPIIVKI
jgi:hypothetical protein